VGELIAGVYAAGVKGKNFDKLVGEMLALGAAVKSGGLVVERFFSTSNYSPEECKKVVALLLTTAEPLASFESIKDAEVKDILVDNEGNLEAWRGVRKAVAAIGLSEPVKALLETLGKEARLDRLKRVTALGVELRGVAAKTVDAVVTSATPLSKAQQDAVAKLLPNYAAGANIATTFVTDAALIGGLTVTLKNASIDLSVNSRLVEVVAAHEA
jgi:F-type H+-transporting ATPase subunit delta